MKSESTIVERTLSSFGKRAYFPNGIVAQSQEAAQKATVVNATAGVALQGKKHISYPLISELIPHLEVDSIVSYAPTAGDPKLRALWNQQMRRKNPLLEEGHYSLPIVTSGLTHSLSIVADLFVEAGDAVIVPTPCWDNYHHIFAVRREGNIYSPSLFNEKLEFSLDSLKELLHSMKEKKIVLILNFPNNPTGYTPTEEEMDELVLLLENVANEKDLVVILDDAYFGLFHTKEVYSYSLFSLLYDLHPNILAIKCDAATKEALAWGFRIGFLTYGSYALEAEHYTNLIQKTMVALRSSVSSSSRVSQTLLINVLEDQRYQKVTQEVAIAMRRRYLLLNKELQKYKDERVLRPLNHNSGYFCAFACEGSAEQLRLELLNTNNIGVVSLEGNLLRIAYSAVDEKEIAPLVKTLYEVAKELWR